MKRGWLISGAAALLTGALLVALLFGSVWPGTGRQAHAALRSTATPSVNAQDMQTLFFVWASGTPAIQRVAAADCARLALSAQRCARISQATRAAWLDLAAHDPSATGRVDVRPNHTARAHALATLTARLTSATGGQLPALLSATRATLALVTQPRWINANILYGLPIPPGTVVVWGTSFQQNSLPSGLNPTTSPYAALPDAFLKYADWGQISNIPALYQPIYAPGGVTANWSVNVANAQGTRASTTVPITDVGPWNEDDNWWDPNATSTTLPSSCPVASPPAFPDATSNALVDGICPTSATSAGNLRRIYYYLLYQHFGLPFFQSAGYKPSGTFADGSAWPGMLARYCSEAAAASTNADGVTCYPGTSAYNGNNSGWARNGTYNVVLNQSSIDLSPAVNAAIGWTYPSSGLVLVTISGLP
ncbi:MAG TPA: hypothetical protein VF808_19540 [Ktedonobacterales bacterium]